MLTWFSQNHPCSLLDIPIFEDVLDVGVIIFAAHLNNEVLSSDPTQRNRKRRHRVYLFYTKTNGEGHYGCIANIRGVLNNSFFCEMCLKGFSNINSHKCEATC